MPEVQVVSGEEGAAEESSTGQDGSEPLKRTEEELKQIEEACQADAKALNWNLVYLEKCGFVELGKSIECPPYIASSATLTAKGIDLIEDQTEFKRLISGKQSDPARSGFKTPSKAQ